MSEQEVEQEVEVQEEQTENKGGTDFVEFQDDATEKRFKRVYGNMKEYERQNQQLVRDQKAALQKIEVLSGQLEGLMQDSTEQRLETLRAEKAAAYESGEIEKVLDIDEKILDAREKAKPAEPTAAEPDPEPEGLSPELQVAINSWSNEVGEDGNYLRPWSHPTHPLYGKAVPVAQTVLEDPDMVGSDTKEFLAEIDRRVTKLFDLGTPKQQGPTVLGGDRSVTPGKGTGTKLTDDQKQIAARMFPKLPPAEAAKRYAKGLA